MNRIGGSRPSNAVYVPRSAQSLPELQTAKTALDKLIDQAVLATTGVGTHLNTMNDQDLAFVASNRFF